MTIDSRTDFYSLGVALYKITTGRLPFTSDDPVKLVHSYIAKFPVAPSGINIGIPETSLKLL